jgi:thioesterase DpgC
MSDNDLERAAAALADRLESGEDPDLARERFLRAHADALHYELSDGRGRPLRLEALLERAAERVPGLVPGRAELEAEHARALADKQRLEIAQGLLLSHVLAAPAAGAHLVWSMLRPTEAVLELRNPRHLNAEDETTLAATEVAVDLALLDPEIEVGVFRGGVVEHPRYAGRRIFGAGINLTHLYRGKVAYVWYLVRDLGYVNKLFRGLSSTEHHPGEPEQTTEKLWIAAVETYAIGGACQLLHVMDHVIAERGARLFLPARKEGIIPGASNLRLARAVGERLARQAILSGREFVAGTPEGDLLCDETVEPDAVDEAISARVDALTSSGLVNAAANRRALRVGQEPLALFQAYMATYAREQAVCHLSPALVANLERNWNAKERKL